jgi:hypothetical protein
MSRRGLRARHLLSVFLVLTLVVTTFSPISLTQVTAAPLLVTCVNLQTGAERISHTGKCRYTQEAQANWHMNPSDSPIASVPTAKVIVVCSNKASSPVSYQVIRKKCARHQVTTVFSRSGSLPDKPVIAEAVSFGYDSASLKLANDPAVSNDAPIAFYTVTATQVDMSSASKVEPQRIYFWKDLCLAINGLQSSTRYTFTVSATTADGTSQLSLASLPVTTPAYVPPAPPQTTPLLAAPAFSLSAVAETVTANTSITGYTISSTGGTIASYAISPTAPAGTTFSTSTGLLTGTPTSRQSATTYTITATNASGSATRTFMLTVTSSFTFVSRTSAADNNWFGVTYGNGLFVAVAGSGTSKVMTSPDGINWTARSAPSSNWTSVTYGNGLFVAVGSTGSNRVMTSPDGINWTARTAATANSWRSVTYGNGLFVAVALSSSPITTDLVMTSPDGINWTSQTTADNNWRSVTYANGTFVAVASSGSNRVMTSPDGITWTSRASAGEFNYWYGVTYGNGLFVAVAYSGTNRVMTSPDGINWTAYPAAANNYWNSVTYGDDLFVAVATSGTGNRVMTSPDGITWTTRTSAADNDWPSVAYGNGTFVAVAYSGTGDRVMTYTP